jgi:hypothetical protein
VIEEPKPRKANYYQPVSWHPWYVSISDWMIRNPSRDLVDCAKDLNRSVATLRYVANSDMFREFHAQRREEWRRHHDFAIISRVTQVAEKSLDLILDKMEKQADKIPMQLITDIATASLDRLGYAPQQTPSVAVNIQDNRTQTISVPVTAAALEEARDALRAAEQKRAVEHREFDVIAGPETSDEVVPVSIEEER